MKAPQVSVTMYNVGFGDCFVLAFDYGGDGVRRVLIDCGSSAGGGHKMADVVDQLSEDCERKVAAVVVTHRHGDHLSAFGEQATRSQLKALKPDLVVRLWTEDPAADKNVQYTAKKPTGLTQLRSYLSLLSEFERLSELLTMPMGAAKTVPGKPLNPEARACLNAMAKQSRGEFLSYGKTTYLEHLLPGVGVRVLGPPTVKQCPGMISEAAEHAEFWKKDLAALTAGLGDADALAALTGLATPRIPSSARWVVEHASSLNEAYVKQLVWFFDNWVNNTSLILLFECGNNKLLFCGDAQIENWQHALERLKKDQPKALRDLTFVKIGHHGSLNGTPKHQFFEQFVSKASPKPLIMASTKEGQKMHEGVPSWELMAALDKGKPQPYRSDQLENNAISVTVRFSNDGTPGEPAYGPGPKH